jgi:acyl-coenzyme A synthetase/AMP-(fatty) acid ligase
VDLIIVDREYAHLLDGFDPSVRRIIDEDTDATEGELSGEFDEAIRQGLEYDAKFGNGWEGLEMEAQNEEDVIALAYTSGTTAKPKVGSIPTASSLPGALYLLFSMLQASGESFQSSGLHPPSALNSY